MLRIAIPLPARSKVVEQRIRHEWEAASVGMSGWENPWPASKQTPYNGRMERSGLSAACVLLGLLGGCASHQPIAEVPGPGPTTTLVASPTTTQSTPAARDDMAIRPFMFNEASLPKGFPGPGPVGTVMVKLYPPSRAAIVQGDNQNRMFGPLFNHIKKHEIAMSAPVEIAWSEPQGHAGEAQPMAMAFVYRDPGIGTPGADGVVQVIDVPAQTYLSIGVRGSYNREHLVEGVKQLRIGWQRILANTRWPGRRGTWATTARSCRGLCGLGTCRFRLPRRAHSPDTDQGVCKQRRVRCRSRKPSGYGFQSLGAGMRRTLLLRSAEPIVGKPPDPFAPALIITAGLRLWCHYTIIQQRHSRIRLFFVVALWWTAQPGATARRSAAVVASTPLTSHRSARCWRTKSGLGGGTGRWRIAEAGDYPVQVVPRNSQCPYSFGDLVLIAGVFIERLNEFVHNELGDRVFEAPSPSQLPGLGIVVFGQVFLPVALARSVQQL